MFVRHAFNYDVDAVSLETGLRCEDVSLAKQEFKEETDINTIIERFGLGYEPPSGVKVPLMEDFSEVYDLQSALNQVNAARETFMLMPADLRARFGNDPHAFVNFCSERDADGKLSNLTELRKFGLVPPEEVVSEPAPVRVEVVPAKPAGTVST